MEPTTRTLPGGPRSALSQLPYLKDPFPWMEQLAQDYSDPLTCPLLGMDPMVLTWDPEGGKAIFTADPDTFVPGTSDALAIIVGSGSIFLQSGERHRRTRKLLAPPFHGDRMRAYGDSMRAAARRWAERISPNASAPILDTCQGITLDIIIEAIFGERDPAKVTDLHAGILALVASFNPLLGVFKFLQRDFFGLGPWVKFQARAKALHDRIDALIALRRSAPGDDILSMLLAVRDDQGAPLSDQEVHEQLVTFIVAGHETTATTLAWAMDHLHRAPDTLATLRAELATAATPDALARLPYLDAVWQETLRLHPPVPVVSRKLTREFVLKGHALPAGTTVGFAVYMAHLRPEVFSEPRVFKPERFVQRTYSPFEYAPFGGGARRCLGAAFAAYELKIVLATLLEGRTFRLDEPAPVRSAFRIGTYGPETGVRMTLLP